MKKESSELTGKQRAELQALEELTDDQIDTSDIPEVLDWTGARRGVFYRPVKQQITLRIDADVIAWFRGSRPRAAAATRPTSTAPCAGTLSAAKGR